MTNLERIYILLIIQHVKYSTYKYYDRNAIMIQ